MVRAVADRAFLPTKNLLEQVGDMMILTGKTLLSAVRPPFPYRDGVRAAVPVRAAAVLVPADDLDDRVRLRRPGLQAGNFLVLFGAIDRLGGFFVLASIREFAPFVTAIILAGVGGTAITADLGARKIREELDALQVLGVDPIKNLVVPRFLALMIVTGLFNIYALIFGIFGGVLATLTFDAPLGPFFATLLNNASTTDLWGSVVKTTLFGAIIAIVSCYKGMTASGGAEGVGRAVNQGVVISFLGHLCLQLRLHPNPPRHPPRNLGDQVSEGLDMHDIAMRIAAAALAVAIVLGSLFLWIGVPVLGMWVAGQVTTSSVGFLFATPRRHPADDDRHRVRASTA